MAKEDKEVKEKIEEKVETKSEEKVTIDKSALEELIKRVENVEKTKNTPSKALYPLKPIKEEFKHKIDGKYSPQDIEYFQDMSYYEGYPRIIAGRVEFTGKKYELDDTYKDMLKGNAPVCMCGKCKDLDSMKSTSLLFVPSKGVWICDAGCETAYNRRFGGFERIVSRHIFARDVPYYGQMLPDEFDPCARRNIVADKRLNEYNLA